MAPPSDWRPERRVRGDVRQDVDDEMRFHLDGLIQEYVEAGVPEPEARRLAERRFGDRRRIAARCRRILGGSPWTVTLTRSHFMSETMRDARRAVRTLVRHPLYAATIVLTLVLGIGASTAVFSVVNGVLLHPLPHPDPHQLVLIWETDARQGRIDDHNRVAAANYADWRELNRSFQSMAAFQSFRATVRAGDDPERLLTGLVTADFFPLLGVSAARGRLFVAEDDQPGRDNVAVLGHEFWRTRFGSDPDVVGRAVRVGGGSFEIVGVLPPDFEFMDQDHGVWLPMGLSPAQLGNRQTHNLIVLGRTRPGTDVAAAQRDMDRVVDGLRDVHPEHLSGWGVNVTALEDEIVGQIRPALVLLMAAVATVLLIAGVNVANLMLTRTAADAREMAIRSALGAGRGRMIRQKLTESTLLGLTGGALGVAAALAATRALVSLAPAGVPNLDRVAVDQRVLAFALLISVLTGLACGLTPALHASGRRAAHGIRDDGRRTTASKSHRRTRSAFVVAQLALSVVLLVSAGLMISTFRQLMRVDPGFRATGVATMKLVLTSPSPNDVAGQIAAWDRLLSAVRAVPGVRSAGLTRFLPLDEGEWTWSVQVVGQPEPLEGEKRDYGYRAVSPDYFATMGISLVAGRDLDGFDRTGGSRAMVVNRGFVRRFFPGGDDPVGRRVEVIGRPDEGYEIVGVVDDVRLHALDRDPLPAYYVSYAQVPFTFFLNEMGLVVRTAGDPAAMAPAVRRAVREADPTVVTADVRTMRDRVAASVARTRFAVTLLGAFAAVALVLATVGVYGVISYAVGQRTREIGVRVALGAEPGRIVRQFLAGGAALIAGGIALGTAGALAAGRLQRGLLFGVDPTDPATYGIVVAVLSLSAMLAVYLPSRRASRVDPMVVLRDE